MWKKGLPDKVGSYWFYGWLHDIKKNKNREPELVFMEVFKTANGLARVANGNFIYKRETVGKYLEANLPTLPDLGDLK